MHRLLVAAVIAAVGLIGPAGVVARAPSTDVAVDANVFDRSSAIVVLKDQPASTYDGHLKGYMKTSPSKGKLNPNSAAYKKYVGYLKQQQSAFQKWLQKNVPSAKITSNYYVAMNAVAVKLNGAAVGKIANSPYVHSIEYVTLYRPAMSESYKHINAAGAWSAAGGRSDAGAGIKVGIIDSGIDSTHEFFDPSGFSYPADFPKCDARNSDAGQADVDCKYTTEKVIVAKVYGNKLNQSGFDAFPLDDLGDHGSHVGGTVAGVTGKTAEVHGVEIDDMSGVAPGAWLGNYNVFPGDVEEARSEDILQAVEDAVTDGMDVVNMSLSGGYHGNNDLLAMGVDNAVAAGVVFSLSAGNNGPGGFTLGSPSRARNAITVGASSNDHFVGQPVTYPASGGTTIGGAVGDFDAFETGDYDLFDTEGDGCASVAAGASGKVALINRGTCAFSQKIENANAAGAIGVIIVNNVAGDPTAMGGTAGFDDDLPAVMIGINEGTALRVADPADVHIEATFAEFISANEDILAGFSSQGPTFVDFAIKPDLTSVGVNVLSAIVDDHGTGETDEDDWAFFNGTSMSAPHIAGSAAVLLDLHPSWTPAQVKSALVSTADRVVTDAFDGLHDVGPLQQGTGRQNLSESADADVFFWPTNASFGVTSGTQQHGTTLVVTLTNSTGSAISFDITEKPFTPSSFGDTHTSTWGAGTIGTGDSRIDTPSSINVPANGTAELEITVTAGQNKSTILGWLDFDGPGGNDYSIVYGAYVP